MRFRRRRPVAIPVRSLDEHPLKNPHPWGEDRTWCTECHRPAYVDDLSFHVWHVGGHDGEMSPANGSCTLDKASP